MTAHPDFLKLYKTEPNPRIRVRLPALHYVYNEEKKYTEVSGFLKYERHAVSERIKRYEKEGTEGVRDRPGRGAEQKLPPEFTREFKRMIIQEQENRKGGHLKGEDIRKILKDNFHSDYSLSGVYELLKRCGMSWVSPRTVHPESDPVQQENFKKTSGKRQRRKSPAM
jgi:transposase